MRIQLAGQRLEAHSIGGIETCYQIQEFGILLDIGRCPPGAERFRTLLLTHGHIDHAAGVPYYISLRSLYGLAPPRVYCPSESLAALDHILKAWKALQADTDRVELIAVDPGDRIPLGGNAWGHAFGSPHRLACRGYTLYRRIRKLLPELAALPGTEIAARVRAGAEVHSYVDRPELCFPGDTSIDVVETEETVRTARLLLLECTFLGERVSRATARAGGHIHLDDIAERAALFQNQAILLTHFSRRHSPDQIRRAVEQKLPSDLLERVHLLLPTPTTDD